MVSIFLEKWHIFLIGSLIAGLSTEVFNNYYPIWEYSFPWNLYVIPIIDVSAVTLFVGWPLISFGALVFASIYQKFFRFGGLILPLVIGWMASGLVSETINSKIFTMWSYEMSNTFSSFIVPFFEFSIFIPTLGWGACGLLAFLFSKIIIFTVNDN